MQTEACGTWPQARRWRPDTLVSMNFWGFSPSIFHAARTYFKAFLHSPAGADLKAECLLPVMVGDLLGRGALEVNVRHPMTGGLA